MELKKEDTFINILTSEYSLMKISDTKKVEIDLGCGKGSFSSALAAKYPETQVYAADVMIGRLRKLQKRNMRMNLDNIQPLRVEARNLLYYMLPDSSIDRLHILCPDPWPKDRHKHNRLLCSDFIGHLFRVIKPGGTFHFSTDDDNYLEPVVRLLEISGLFKRDDSVLDDISEIKTDFEVRWLEMGRTVAHTGWSVCK
jgi:tRNA (guanine-N7-)-methyltransferase